MKLKKLTLKKGPLSLSVIFALLALLFAIVACSPGAPAQPPTQAAVATSGEGQQTYSVQSIYDDALEYSSKVVENQMAKKAQLRGISWALIVMSIGVLIVGFNPLGCGGTILVALIVGFVGWIGVRSQITESAWELSHEFANVALNEGVDRAQKAQAANQQYIAATLSGFGTDTMTCTTTVNHKSDCATVSSYYSVNTRYNCRTWEDSDGNEHESCDTKYTPWFDYLWRDYVVVATKAKYLDERVYTMKCVNPETSALQACSHDADGNLDDRNNPAVMLHTDWRAPKTEAPSSRYENRTPQLWLDMQAAQTAANNGNTVETITGYFVGKYSHWNLAANSPDVVVFDGPYQRLQQLVELPGPDGNWFNFTNDFGQRVSMETLLHSDDQDLATELNPVFFIGFEEVSPELYQQMNEKAREFQGTYGPGKQSINYLVIINEDVVQQMGGIFETTTALMGWLQDEGRWGLFRIPKNQTVTIAVAPNDLTNYNQLNFETGLPWGNILVKQDVRLSIDAPQPLNWDSLMGTVDSSYTSAQQTGNGSANGFGVTMDYSFSDMTQAGGVIGLLYENDLPENADRYPTPDPNSDECETAQPEHPGYVRYQMCTQQFLQTTIRINEDGKALIMNDVAAASRGAVGGMPSVTLWLTVLFMAIGFRGKLEQER